MATSPSTKNYTLGKGKLFFDWYKDGSYVGERHLGNAPAISFNVSLEALEHFSSTGGLKAKDKKVISQITPQFNFTLDEISAANMAMLLMADVTDVSQAAADANSKALTGVMPGYWYKLDKRGVGIWALGYDGGTGAFTVGDTVSGATGSGDIVEIIGDTVSGTLYISGVTAGFVDDESLTDASTGAANANGVETFIENVSVEDTDSAGTFFTLGTDFMIDVNSGRIGIIAGGAIDGTTVTNLTVVYANLAVDYKTINALENTELEGRMVYVSDNPVGNNMEMEIWRVSLVPSGDTALIGDDWATVSFEGEILKDETGHPSNPYLEMRIIEAA